MDFFYKPPMQRTDECTALEENYINCLLQKALKDNVMNNRCNMDSILWFHLECPRAAARFDDPNAFKLKFRDFFAHTKLDAQILYERPEHMEKLRKEYDTNVGPDDVTFKPALKEFMVENKQHNPERVADEDPTGDFYSSHWDELVDIPDRDYAPKRPAPPLTTEDSAKFGDAAPFKF